MRQILLGKAPLGKGQGGGVAHQADYTEPPYYLLRDEFTTDRAAGSVNGTLAEPGPGRRAVTDTNSKLSITGGVLSFATGGAGNGDPSIQWTPQQRRTGRLFMATVTPSVSTISIGWDENAGGTITDAFRFLVSSGRLDIRDNTNAVAVGAFAGGTSYQVAIALRETGSFFFIKGGAFTNWTLMFIVQTEGTSPMYPTVAAEGSLTVATVDNARVPATSFAPVPLVSDGFSIDGESDGLGHLEGVLLATYGQGGAGVSWTDAVGTWAVTDGALAASALSGGRAIRTADCGKADLIITVKMTLSSGTMSLIVRWTDENNFVQLRLTSTNLQLVKVVSGTPTTVADTAITYVAGAPVRLICQGSAFRRFYNDAAIGSESTISDGALASATVVGLRTDDTGNTFDDFVAYARGSGGEYDTALDAL